MAAVTWARHKDVTVVECPGCGFCFDADHADMAGGYSCPACFEVEMRERFPSAAEHVDSALARREAALPNSVLGRAGRRGGFIND